MSVALVTGLAGLVGSETCRRFAREGSTVVGIDDDMRARFFGADTWTAPTRARLERELPDYRHFAIDVRDQTRIGDHIWWISDVAKFESHYPGWTRRYGIRDDINAACAR
jgi:NAD(P)-dependent dehydrogenase (short-subunit alcohol dehydrogenase family)